jgi:predicted TIM-barrel fold metal-dependent hydrolase
MARAAATTRTSSTQVPVKLVDTDVHVVPRSGSEVIDYLSEPWRSRSTADMGVERAGVFVPPHGVNRQDGFPSNGSPPGSDPQFLEKQLFSETGVDYAVLIPLLVRPRANPDHEVAMASAVNSWQADTWLSKYNQHRRYYGTIFVCPRDPAAAVNEIERWAGDKRFVQVMPIPSVIVPFCHVQ